MVIEWSKLSNELAINWSRTYVRLYRIQRHSPLRGVRESRVREALVVRGGSDSGFCHPFSTLFASQPPRRRRRRRWWRRECGVIFFTELVCLQLLFQRKFANGSPLSPVSAALLRRLPHIVRQFFSPPPPSPDTPPSYASPTYVRHDFYALAPTNNGDGPVRLTCDRWTTAKKEKLYSRHEIPPRSWLLPAKWIFVSLLFLAITPSGVE